MKELLVFGSTGSIGRSALDVVRKDPRQFNVRGLSAGSNIRLLRKQIKEFKPAYVCVADEDAARILKKEMGRGIEFFSGREGLLDFAAVSSDISLMGIVGIASLEPLLINLKHTKRMALASKETLVTAGELVTRTARSHRTLLVPVDSEINALFQLLENLDRRHVVSLYLTASGGALLDYSGRRLRSVTAKEVLAHPTWSMGKRVTVDSATLVNKGFEVIESHFLFDMPYDDIDIVIHRQSMVHAFVEMRDTMLFACLYTPSMKVPIAHSLYYPARIQGKKRGGIFSRKKIELSFSRCANGRFPLFRLVVDAARQGGNLPVIVNAADEVVVDSFLKGRVAFRGIYDSLAAIVSQAKKRTIAGVEDVLYWDEWARIKTKEFLGLRRQTVQKRKKK